MINRLSNGTCHVFVNLGGNGQVSSRNFLHFGNQVLDRRLDLLTFIAGLDQVQCIVTHLVQSNRSFTQFVGRVRVGASFEITVF